MEINYSSYSDIELVRLFKEDKKIQEIAFTELYQRYSSMVHAYCFKVLGNQQQAEDIFQDVFLKFYQKVDADYHTINVPGFLIRIARNLCINQKKRKKEIVNIENFENLLQTTQSYEKKELLELINVALDLLDDEFKECFILREYNGMPYNEIAEICEITVANAKSRVFRAKKKIKKLLKPYLKDLHKQGN